MKKYKGDVNGFGECFRDSKNSDNDLSDFVREKNHPGTSRPRGCINHNDLSPCLKQAWCPGFESGGFLEIQEVRRHKSEVRI